MIATIRGTGISSHGYRMLYKESIRGVSAGYLSRY